MRCSVGIFAFNEEKNIVNIIGAILSQKVYSAEINEVIIVASGCTDSTVSIAENTAKSDSRIRILSEPKREGKAKAINTFLAEAKNEILIIESADTIPRKDAIEKLVSPFTDETVGMTGARPIPVDNPKTLMGFTTHLLWNLHHFISLKNPKMGEMVAFRKIFDSIPETAVDEAQIEEIIARKGYRIIYIPGAVVYNKGPESVGDFMRQRRRVHCGHLILKKETGYKVSTSNSLELFLLVLEKEKINFRFFLFLPMAIVLEGLSKFLGWWDFAVRRKDHVIWEVAKSTKNIDKIA